MQGRQPNAASPTSITQLCRRMNGCQHITQYATGNRIVLQPPCTHYTHTICPPPCIKKETKTIAQKCPNCN